MIYLNDSVLQTLKERLKIGDKKVNVRVEVDKFDYIPGQTSEFSTVMLSTDKTAPALNLSGVSVNSAVEVMFPLQGKSISDYEPIKDYVKFGAPRYREGKYHHDHRGIDFGAPKGHPVVAVADGEVVAKIVNHATAGNMLEILHDNGYRSIYMHLNNFAKINGMPIALGTKVSQGQVIAYVGNTGTIEHKQGLDSNHHLHFEIRKNSTKSDRGTPVDPYPFLKGSQKLREVGTLVTTSAVKSDNNLYYDYITEKVYESNFSNIAELNKYVQSAAVVWGIGKDGSIPVLTPKKVVASESTIYKTFHSTNDTLISVKLKAVLSGGETLKFYVDGQVVHTVTESTNDYTTITIQVPASLNGTQTFGIAITPNTTVQRVPNVFIQKIEIYNRYRRIANNSDLEVSDVKNIVVNSDLQGEAYVKSSPDPSAANLVQLNAGDKFTFLETIFNGDNKWYKTVHNGQEGYINSDHAYLQSDSDIVAVTYQVPTGAFVYSKTVVLEDVISVDIDYKYEMRAAEATITLFNKSGRYNPDYNPALFNDISEPGYAGLFVENAPVRIYIGYGDNLQRRFTGLISNVSTSSDGYVLTINCVDMMKLLNDFTIYNVLKYGNENEVWLASAVIQDLVNRAGMNSWRIINEDINRTSVVVEESYYTDVRPESGIYVTFSEYGEEITKPISSIPEGTGFRNPAWWSASIPVGTNIGDYIEDMCKMLGYWQRCDCYGTYYATLHPFMNVSNLNNVIPQFKFTDGENLVRVSKSYDYSKIRNHLIINGPYETDHFFDTELFKYTLGVRKTASEYYDFANTYGKRYAIAKKLFYDIKTLFKTLQVAVEGNPYIELMDVVEIYNRDTNTKGKYVVKGIKDSYTDDQGYITTLDLYWLGVD